jgi:hypothetical protein
MNLIELIARFWRGTDHNGGSRSDPHSSQANVASEESTAEPPRAIETGIKKVPISIAAPWTGVGHPDNTLKTIAILMEGERREF